MVIFNSTMLKLEHVALWTRNLDLLREYYTKHFQGEAGTVYHNPRKEFRSYFITFENGLRLELMSIPGLHSGDGEPAGTPHTGWIHIAFEVASRREVDMKAIELQEHGYRITDGPRMTGDGYYEFATLDPDNNLVEVGTKASNEEPSGGIPELTLQTMDQRFAICRLPADTPVPEWASGASFCSVTCSREEISVVCPDARVPEEVEAERNWRIFKVRGILDFSLTGILAHLLDPLKKCGIPTFVLSTYRTDYLLVRDDDYEKALSLLGGICQIEKIGSESEKGWH